LLCTSARVAVSAAKLRVLPASVAKVHAGSGVPRVATALLSTVLAIACTLPFSQLVSISMLFYGATTLIEVLALLALRVSEPLTPRPFRIPLRASPLALLYAGPVLLCVVLALLAPPEAWLLFLASSAAAGVAHARSSGATLSSAARACASGPGWWWRRRPAARYLLPADAAAKAGVQLDVFDQASQRGSLDQYVEPIRRVPSGSCRAAAADEPPAAELSDEAQSAASSAVGSATASSATPCLAALAASERKHT